MKRRIRIADVVVGSLIIVFFAAAKARTYPRFVQYRGEGHAAEFLVYALVILAVTFVLWRAFRRYEWETWVLVLTASGVLLHIAAGFFQVDQGRLYDLQLGVIRFDKVVHAYSAFVATLFVQRVFAFAGIRLGRLRWPVVILVVLGICSVWEMVEYLVLLTIPHNGVGDYHNNLQDLIANLIGSTLFVFVPRRMVAPEEFHGRMDSKL